MKGPAPNVAGGTRLTASRDCNACRQRVVAASRSTLNVFRSLPGISGSTSPAPPHTLNADGWRNGASRLVRPVQVLGSYPAALKSGVANAAVVSGMKEHPRFRHAGVWPDVHIARQRHRCAQDPAVRRLRARREHGELRNHGAITGLRECVFDAWLEPEWRGRGSPPRHPPALDRYTARYEHLVLVASAVPAEARTARPVERSGLAGSREPRRSKVRRGEAPGLG
jgi:hypothetical protein